MASDLSRMKEFGLTYGSLTKLLFKELANDSSSAISFRIDLF